MGASSYLSAWWLCGAVPMIVVVVVVVIGKISDPKDSFRGHCSTLGTRNSRIPEHIKAPLARPAIPLPNSTSNPPQCSTHSSRSSSRQSSVFSRWPCTPPPRRFPRRRTPSRACSAVRCRNLCRTPRRAISPLVASRSSRTASTTARVGMLCSVVRVLWVGGWVGANGCC